MRYNIIVDNISVPDHVYREAVMIGLKEYAYEKGYSKPNYPVPAKLTMTDEYGRYHSAYRWMDNFDDFWTQEHGARGFSL